MPTSTKTPFHIFSIFLIVSCALTATSTQMNTELDEDALNEFATIMWKAQADNMVSNGVQQSCVDEIWPSLDPASTLHVSFVQCLANHTEETNPAYHLNPEDGTISPYGVSDFVEKNVHQVCLERMHFMICLPKTCCTQHTSNDTVHWHPVPYLRKGVQVLPQFSMASVEIAPLEVGGERRFPYIDIDAKFENMDTLNTERGYLEEYCIKYNVTGASCTWMDTCRDFGIHFDDGTWTPTMTAANAFYEAKNGVTDHVRAAEYCSGTGARRAGTAFAGVLALVAILLNVDEGTVDRVLSR